MERNESYPHYDHDHDEEIESWIISVPLIGGMIGSLVGGNLRAIVFSPKM